MLLVRRTPQVNHAKRRGTIDETPPERTSSCCPPPRTAARRDRVIDAARRLIAEQGFHNAGIAQIARDSGVLVGQIYRDFASKEDIVVAIAERDTRAFLNDEGLRKALATGDAAGLRAWIARLVACDEEGTDRRIIAEIIAEASRSEKIAGIVHHIPAAMRRDLLAALDRLVPGEARRERREMLAEVILTIAGGVFQRRLTEEDRPSAAVVEALVDGILGRIDQLAQEA
jgi:AcrR family transcriptional regulator